MRRLTIAVVIAVLAAPNVSALALARAPSARGEAITAQAHPSGLVGVADARRPEATPHVKVAHLPAISALVRRHAVRADRPGERRAAADRRGFRRKCPAPRAASAPSDGSD